MCVRLSVALCTSLPFSFTFVWDCSFSNFVNILLFTLIKTGASDYRDMFWKTCAILWLWCHKLKLRVLWRYCVFWIIVSICVCVCVVDAFMFVTGSWVFFICFQGKHGKSSQWDNWCKWGVQVIRWIGDLGPFSCAVQLLLSLCHALPPITVPPFVTLVCTCLELNAVSRVLLKRSVCLQGFRDVCWSFEPDHAVTSVC